MAFDCVYGYNYIISMVLYMIKSIQKFISSSVGILEKIMTKFVGNSTKIAEMVYDITDSITDSWLNIISEEL